MASLTTDLQTALTAGDKFAFLMAVGIFDHAAQKLSANSLIVVLGGAEDWGGASVGPGPTLGVGWVTA